MTPDDATRVHQIARVLAAGGEPAAALRHVLRVVLGPVPLPAPVVSPPRLVSQAAADEPEEVRQLRAFAERFPAVMRGWFR